MDLNKIVDELTENIDKIPDSKKYWLIRTQSGSLYDSFIENNYIGLDHHEVSLEALARMRKMAKKNRGLFQDEIKQSVQHHYNSLDKPIDVSPQRIGLISGQIFRFYNDVKVGDIVIIPSSNSDLVSFGTVESSDIAVFSEEESRKIDTTQFLNKKVKWITEFRRHSLDPNIFRMFTAHHAISDVSRYAAVIERSLNDFFILDDDAHLIINVQQEDDLKARSVFGMGHNFLELFDEIVKELKLEGVSSNDLEITVNLNSPGKIDLKSNIKKTTLVAGLILLVCGGGYTTADGTSLKTDGIKVLLDAISDYRDRNQDRDMQMEIFNRYKDSLNVKSPDDLIKLMKQVDQNQDLAK